MSSRFELSIPLCFASKMRSRPSSFCLALFLFIPSIATQTCTTPRTANCCENNSTNQADFPVPFESPTVLGCCFDQNLCHYSQGCVDNVMSRWSTHNVNNEDYASVSQNETGSGSYVYSVLESPWVTLSKTTCVEFTYFRGNPYQLQVFLAFNNGTQPRLMEDSVGVGHNKSHTARFNIEPMTVKIQFRVLGGGAISKDPPPKLFNVTFIESGCVHPDGQSTVSPIEPRLTSTQCTQVSVTAISSPGEPLTASDTTHLELSSVVFHFSPDGDSGNNAAVIAGVTVTVVVVPTFVVIIIIVKVYRRKRRQRSGSDDIRPRAETQEVNGQLAIQSTDNSSTLHAEEMSDLRDPSRPSDASNYYFTPLNVYDGLTNRNLEEHAYADMTNQNNTYEIFSQDRGDNRPYDSLAAQNNVELAEQRAGASSEYYNTVSLQGYGSSSSTQAPASPNGSDYQNI